ncbi:hypothetical protein KBC03_02645 [Patescibacteria group bacterium]|nr:hypothetical protein [Patescibacteria group bacterium]
MTTILILLAIIVLAIFMPETVVTLLIGAVACLVFPVLFIGDQWARYKRLIKIVLFVFGAIVTSVVAFAGEVVLAGSFLAAELIFGAAIFIAVLTVAVLYYTAPIWGPWREKLQKQWREDPEPIIQRIAIVVIPLLSVLVLKFFTLMQEATPSNPGF